jgi:hypothetical protein
LQQLQEDGKHAEQRYAAGNHGSSIIRCPGAVVGRRISTRSVFGGSVVGSTRIKQRSKRTDHREHTHFGCAAGVPNPC